MKIPKISHGLLSEKSIRKLLIRLEKDIGMPYTLKEKFRRIYEKRRNIEDQIWEVSNEARWFFESHEKWFKR